MSKRSAAYRCGDRAESLGIELMRAFCAMAPIPRPEDFGLVDAIATLLRREGQFLFAEDSFIVQFKSKSEKQLAFEGDSLRMLRQQDLSVFAARVDIRQNSIELFSLAPAFAHPNFWDTPKVVLRFGERLSTVNRSILEMSFGAPVLRWSASELTDKQFAADAYEIIRRWIHLDRENRQHRCLGRHVNIRWRTGEAPSPNGVSLHLKGSNAELRNCLPALNTIAACAIDSDKGAIATLSLIEWLNELGIQYDPHESPAVFLKAKMSQRKIERALERCALAELGASIVLAFATEELVSMWTYTANRRGQMDGSRLSGNPGELKKCGIDAKIEKDASREEVQVQVSIGPDWAALHGLEVVGVDGDVLLLRCRNRSSEASNE